MKPCPRKKIEGRSGKFVERLVLVPDKSKMDRFSHETKNGLPAGGNP
jgi:hypothetical protein